MSKRTPNIVFFGTPHLAVYILEELEAAGIVPDVVVTAPDAPKGRKLVMTPPPVKVWAEEHEIPVLQPESIKEPGDVPELANTEWDVFIVAAYNKILPKWLLDAPRHGVLNVHPSLLPKLRGPSPIRSAILRDEKDSVGVTVIQLDEQMDHGPIVAQATIDPLEGGDEGLGWPVMGRILDEVLFREGGRLLAEALPLWLAGNITPEPQNHDEATYTRKLTKADGEIQLDDDPYQNWLKYCAYDEWPGVYTFIEDRNYSDSQKKVESKQGEASKDTPKTRIKITEAEYENGEFRPLRVVPEGKKGIDWKEYVRSAGMGDGYGNGGNSR